jgi:predicted metal-dependent hydrolase
MNHGKKFWALVAKAVPDYKLRRRELMKIKLA